MFCDERGALYGVQDVVRVRRSRCRNTFGRCFALSYRHTAADRRLPPSSTGSTELVVASARARLVGATVFTSGPCDAEVVGAASVHFDASVQTVVTRGSALGGQSRTKNPLLYRLTRSIYMVTRRTYKVPQKTRCYRQEEPAATSISQSVLP